VFTTVGTGSSGSGTTPITWDIADADGPVTLSGTIYVAYLPTSEIGPPPAGNLAFASTATGVSVTTSGNSLTIKYPVNGTMESWADSTFWSTGIGNSQGGGGESLSYSITLTSPPATEKLYYTSTIGLEFAMGGRGSNEWTGTLNFTFSEKIAAA
jgi:hypothetical protein